MRYFPLLPKSLDGIYGYEVKRLNAQVKNNGLRFPEDFMFQLTNKEVDDVNFPVDKNNHRAYIKSNIFERKHRYVLICNRNYIHIYSDHAE